MERSIKPNGTSTYKIKDHEGKVVKGEAKKTVTEIADKFNIQVENPVMIMTQERQKSFITAKENELFEFFHEGIRKNVML